MTKDGDKRVRVLLAKLGLDSHTIGVTVIAAALRDAGMEVIFSGLKQTPEMVVKTAIEEDVDVVGLSSLSAAHMRHFPRVVELLRAQGAGDKLVLGGGVIPEEDARALRRGGVQEIFTMGTPTGDIVAYIRNWYAEHRQG
ncbi:MAG: cobalamin B12-binding domain-containing protein [Deltaproteobacteria bacterium]|nr:cobalamin B12-binding domain-containing protein [Deltaproteobacteria bacterium]